MPPIVSTEVIRQLVYTAYGSWKWKINVDKMSDREIKLMYKKLIKSGIIKE